MVRSDDVQRSLQARLHTVLPYDPLVYLKSVNEGVPFVLGQPRSLPAERIQRMVQTLVIDAETEAAPADGQRRLRLAGLLRRG